MVMMIPFLIQVWFGVSILVSRLQGAGAALCVLCVGCGPECALLVLHLLQVSYI